MRTSPLLDVSQTPHKCQGGVGTHPSHPHPQPHGHTLSQNVCATQMHVGRQASNGNGGGASEPSNQSSTDASASFYFFLFYVHRTSVLDRLSFEFAPESQLFLCLVRFAWLPLLRERYIEDPGQFSTARVRHPYSSYMAWYFIWIRICTGMS